MKGKTIYYLNKIGGLWKKDKDDEFFFSRELLKWVDKKKLYYIWKQEPVCDIKVNKKYAEEYIRNCINFGKIIDPSPLKYCLDDSDVACVYAVDKQENEYFIQRDMILESIKKGTINPEWMLAYPISEIEAKENTIGTIFTINNSYTYMDEDYSYHFTVFWDGSLYISQMESYCYEKNITTVERPKSNEFKEKVLELFNSYEKEINNQEDYCDLLDYDGEIFDTSFSLDKIKMYPFFKEMTGKLKQLIDEYYPNEINWSISINNEYNGI